MVCMYATLEHTLCMHSGCFPTVLGALLFSHQHDGTKRDKIRALLSAAPRSDIPYRRAAQRSATLAAMPSLGLVSVGAKPFSTGLVQLYILLLYNPTAAQVPLAAV